MECVCDHNCTVFGKYVIEFIRENITDLCRVDNRCDMWDDQV